MADITTSLVRVSDSFKKSFGVNNLVPGTKMYQIAESIAYESSAITDEILSYASKNSIITATGITLDDIAWNVFGMKRLTAERHSVSETMRSIKFYTNNSVIFGDINKNPDGTSNDIIIPEGTIISGNANGTTYSFRVSKQTILSKNTSEAFVSAELINGDYKLIPANTLKAHNFTGYTNSSSRLLLVTNPTSIGSSREEESDDNFRYRISTMMQSRVDSSYYGIRNQILTMPGVSNVLIFPGSGGGGNFSVVVQGTTPITSLELINNVKTYLSNIIPDWISYTVSAPNYVGITATININAGQNVILASTINDMQEAAKSYINNFYGRVFKPLQLQNMLMSYDTSLYSVTLVSMQTYIGSGDYRMYENISVVGDPAIYLSSYDKLIVEQGIDIPITIIQVT